MGAALTVLLFFFSLAAVLSAGPAMLLSISLLHRGSHRYYSELAREDYYTEGGGGPPGRYAGKGTEALGLTGMVSKQALQNLFKGLSPDGRESLVQLQKGKREHLPGWDLTFSAPKSVSIAWALSDEPLRQKIEEAHRAAVLEAIAYLEAEAAWGRRGKGGKTVEPVSLVALLYDHHTSRLQDMALHTHALVMNVGVRPDGTTGAIRSLDLFQHKMAAGAIYRAELARQMKILGFDLRKGEHSFELACVPKKVIDGFSKRSAEIREAMARDGASGPIAAELAALSTRQRKGHVERPALLAKWKREAGEMGLEQVRPGREQPAGEHLRVPEDSIAKASMDLANERGAFHERDLLRRTASALEHTGVGASKLRAAIRTFVSSSKDIELLPEKRLSTKAHLTIERSLIDVALRSKDQRSHVVQVKHLARAEARFPTLSYEQRNALRHVTAELGTLKLVEGYAGTGKTTLLCAAAAAWRFQGLTVVGAAVAKSAANSLQREAGIQSRTLESLERLLARSPADELKHHARQIGRVARDNWRREGYGNPKGWRKVKTSKLERGAIGPKTVLVIDEASMVSTAQVMRVARAARERGAKVVLVGDSAQLPAIEAAGGAFSALAKALGAAKLQNIHRQQRRWQREASRHFAEGDAATGLSLYAAAGRVAVATTRDQAKHEMVDAWFQGRGSDPRETLMVAGSRRDVTDLNRLAQEKRKEAGELGKLYVTVNGQRLHAGDRVVLNRNNPALGLTNGDTAVVERVVPAVVGKHSKLSLIVDTPGEKPRRVAFELRTYDQVALGYATTVHKSQGLTHDRSLVLAGGWMQDKELTYVEMTRHRDDCLVFVSEADAGEDLAELARAAQRSHAQETALDFRRELEERHERELLRQEGRERECLPS